MIASYLVTFKTEAPAIFATAILMHFEKHFDVRHKKIVLLFISGSFDFYPQSIIWVPKKIIQDTSDLQNPLGTSDE